MIVTTAEECISSDFLSPFVLINFRGENLPLLMTACLVLMDWNASSPDEPVISGCWYV